MPRETAQQRKQREQLEEILNAFNVGSASGSIIKRAINENGYRVKKVTFSLERVEKGVEGTISILATEKNSV